ncbi:DUF6338 family protein [Promicromonospora sp. NPDC023987]|uniref:DUF6338 family protein n=1 Tax=Promicromonospora sp. NPDC023987 TaxID=3155360 RepID=UPI00340A1885
MAPSSVGTFISFLLLLAPGALWQLIRARYKPSVKETTLSELARVVLISLLATTAASLVLLFPVWLPLFRHADSISLGTPNSMASVLPYLAGVVATSATACGLVLIVTAHIWPEKPPISEGRVWSQAFVESKPDDADSPFLTVELLDGTIWRGELATFDADPEDANRNLALTSPLRRKRPGEQFKNKDGRGSRLVLLPEVQVKSIQVEYHKATAAGAIESEKKPHPILRRLRVAARRDNAAEP